MAVFYKYFYLLNGEEYILYAPTREEADHDFKEEQGREPLPTEFLRRERW